MVQRMPSVLRLKTLSYTGQLFSSTFDIMFKITDLVTVYNIKSSNEKAVGDKKFCCRSCLSDI